MKKISTYAAVAVLAVTLLAPVAASANIGFGFGTSKNSAKTDHVVQKTNAKPDVSTNAGCFKAWGYMFAFGWMKDQIQLQPNADCYFPFGWGNKFGPVASSSPSTPDTTAPVVTNVSATTGIGTVTLTWNTDENADSAVYFSTTDPVTVATSTPHISRNDRTKNHKVVIGNLAAGTTYYAVVRSKDKAGNTTVSSQITFTTKIPDTTNDTKAPVIKNIVGVVSTSTIEMGWKTNEFATSKVYYSTATPVDTGSAATVASASLVQNHLLAVPSLSLGTKYYFVVESSDAANNVTRSTEFSFTTQGSNPTPDTVAPILSSISTSESSTSITVNWTTNEPATSKVYYNAGNSIDISTSTTAFVSDSTLALTHSLSIPALSTSTAYSLVIESQDASANTADGPQISATTLAL